MTNRFRPGTRRDGSDKLRQDATYSSRSKRFSTAVLRNCSWTKARRANGHVLRWKRTCTYGLTSGEWDIGCRYGPDRKQHSTSQSASPKARLNGDFQGDRDQQQGTFSLDRATTRTVLAGSLDLPLQPSVLG